MANIKSAKKRVRVNAVKAEQNKALKSELKTAIKKADLAIVNGDENRAEAVKAAVKKIDQVAPRDSCTRTTLPQRRQTWLLSGANRKRLYIIERLN